MKYGLSKEEKEYIERQTEAIQKELRKNTPDGAYIAEKAGRILDVVSDERINRKLENEALAEVVAGLIDCGTADVDCIVDMEKNFEGTIERAIELQEEIGEPKMNFGLFVMAVKDKAIDTVTDELLDEDRATLEDMVIDDNYLAWGCIANYGAGSLPTDIQSNFGDYVKGTMDKKAFLDRYRKYREEVEE